MPRKPPTSRRAKAIKAFRNRHIDLFGVPSGDTTWDITVSKDPRKWRYEAYFRQQSESAMLSDLVITACISWHWAEVEEHPETEIWAEAVTRTKTIVLGSTPIPPTPPAEITCEIHCATYFAFYHGKFKRFTYAALGEHSVICEFGNPTAILIEHIRRKSIERLNLPNSRQRAIDLADWAEATLANPYVRP